MFAFVIFVPAARISCITKNILKESKKMTNKNYELNEKELDQVMGGTGVYSILPKADGTSFVIAASS